MEVLGRTNHLIFFDMTKTVENDPSNNTSMPWEHVYQAITLQ
jgi:hypothetical protein